MRIFDKFLPNKYKVLKSYKKKLDKLDGVELLKRNGAYKGTHKNERCFILGNGPSLQKEKLGLLRNETVFCVNDIYANDFYSEINPTYHLFIDPVYENKIQELITTIYNLNVSPIIITNLQNRNILRDNEIYPNIIYLKSGFDIDYLHYVGLHINGLLPYFCTVVQYAISVAIEMGYSEIYLLGCDCTGIQNHIQKISGMPASTYGYDYKKTLKTDENTLTNEHAFYEWYHIFKSYRMLNEYAINNGTQIVDLTYSGILDVFPKNLLEKVL